MYKLLFPLLLALSLCFPFTAQAVSDIPQLQILAVPTSGATLQQGQRFEIKWSASDPDGISFQSVSLYQLGSDKGLLRKSTVSGTVEHTWSVTAPAGSGYHLHFFAADNQGEFIEKDSSTFTIAEEVVLNIPGHLLGDPDSNGAMTATVGFGLYRQCRPRQKRW